jgi:WD40 repeat protein
MKTSTLNRIVICSGVVLLLTCSPFLLPTTAQQATGEKLPQIPKPFATFKNAKEFNAVQFGPGNTFSIAQIPPEFQLSEFAMSANGGLLAMGWASGKIELWDVNRKKKVSDFKSEVGAPGVLKFDAQGTQLIVTGSGGKVAFLELPKGRKIRGFVIPLGKFKYDLQQIVLDPNGKWMAYADEESSKVLDITSENPKIIGDLQDAGSIALSQDGSELWTVNRNELTGYNTSTWQMIGHWPHLSSPVKTSSTLVSTGISQDGIRTVAVPSEKGLIIYAEPEMKGTFGTSKQTISVGFSPSTKSYVNIASEITFLSAMGKVLCRKSYESRSGFSISEDGQWLALSLTNKVNIWRMEDLTRDCEAAR